jgi:hypothetical protein
MSKSIEFNTAKLAKEKGFSEIAQSGFGFSLYNQEGQKVSSTCYFSKEKEDFFLRPTQSELKKWLREEHRIHVSANPWKDEMSDSDSSETPKEGFQILYEGNIVDVNDDWNIFAAYSYHHSYEDCLELQLLTALNLIKTKTNELQILPR